MELSRPSLTPTSSFSSSSSFKSVFSSKLEYLYEIEYLPDEARVPPTSFPVVNPYSVYMKPPSGLKSTLKKLIGKPTPTLVKEYVQTSKFNQNQVPANEAEHFFPIELPREYLQPWLSQGYTHIHFGAVKIAPTFHGRKGLPVISHLGLLDTRFTQYQYAVIENIQTTLNSGTMFITLYPNFNLPLNDPHTFNALAVQVQISGALQIATSYAATVHYQIAYRIQNHYFDIPFPEFIKVEETLFLKVDTNKVSHCTYVPRQLSTGQLQLLLPDKWITNYENIHLRLK